MRHMVALASTLAASPAMAHGVHDGGHTHAPLFLIALFAVLVLAAIIKAVRA